MDKGFAMIAFEKRKMERFSLELPSSLSVVDARRNQEPIELLTENVCAGGAFLKTDTPLSVGTSVKMNLTLPFDNQKELGGKQSRIDISGSVIRTDDEGMAVCFDKNYSIKPNSADGT